MPHSTGLGTPMSHRPTPITTPKAALSASWVRKKRLSRRAASSMAAVVRCRSLEPNSRIMRSRRSSRCSRMKISTTKIDAGVASGCRTGARKRARARAGVGSGWRTSTGRGLSRPSGAACAGVCVGAERGRGLSSFVACSIGVRNAASRRQAAKDAFPEPRRLVADRLLVARQIGRERRDLGADDRAERDDDPEGDEHRDGDGRNASEPEPAHEFDERREHESEQDREHDRQEDIAPEYRAPRSPRRRQRSVIRLASVGVSAGAISIYRAQAAALARLP